MSKTLIIAEIGVNHNGEIKIAKELINIAANAGVDIVKFQSFKANSLVTKEAKKASYQIENTNDKDDTQFEMLRSLELSHLDHVNLINHCRKKDVKFLSSAFDIDGIDYLNSLGLDMFKIPSGEITNLNYLRKISQIGKPVLLSTGMSNIIEIQSAVKILLQGIDIGNITILHCNTEYPTPMSEVNLKAMLSIKKKFNCEVGYSDHTLGIEVPIAAVALGASVIEKHITLDRKMSGPDHKASLEPDELKSMVKAIRNIEKAISGSGVKELSKSEKKNISVVRKSIVAKSKINIGEVFSEKNLTVKRPGTGISPMLWDDVIGVKAKDFFNEGDLITI